ncbi:UNKNOWN [Stylonychia lemnae]|uniref:Uncharacterized protein n=1 Tax=Stylonychia lemnae TaxID=5949 RepID=A0A078ABI5_STYLE|nr:UNKNOWN [Stylonychia lemnae]|eukprot:CDW79231.1 UNKNOWN [Stylonychia lemnae]
MLIIITRQNCIQTELRYQQKIQNGIISRLLPMNRSFQSTDYQKQAPNLEDGEFSSAMFDFYLEENDHISVQAHLPLQNSQNLDFQPNPDGLKRIPNPSIDSSNQQTANYRNQQSARRQQRVPAIDSQDEELMAARTFQHSQQRLNEVGVTPRQPTQLREQIVPDRPSIHMPDVEPDLKIIARKQARESIESHADSQYHSYEEFKRGTDLPAHQRKNLPQEKEKDNIILESVVSLEGITVNSIRTSGLSGVMRSKAEIYNILVYQVARRGQSNSCIHSLSVLLNDQVSMISAPKQNELATKELLVDAYNDQMIKYNLPNISDERRVINTLKPQFFKHSIQTRLKKRQDQVAQSNKKFIDMVDEMYRPVKKEVVINPRSKKRKRSKQSSRLIVKDNSLVSFQCGETFRTNHSSPAKRFKYNAMDKGDVGEVSLRHNAFAMSQHSFSNFSEDRASPQQESIMIATVKSQPYSNQNIHQPSLCGIFHGSIVYSLAITAVNIQFTYILSSISVKYFSLQIQSLQLYHKCQSLPAFQRSHSQQPQKQVLTQDIISPGYLPKVRCDFPQEHFIFDNPQLSHL